MTHALTRYRETNDLTLDGLAQRLGVLKSQVWKWENGTIPRPPQMQKIVDMTAGEVSANDWYATKHSGDSALAVAVARVDDAAEALSDASEALDKIAGEAS